MIYEERIYTLEPGKVGEYFAIYEKEGLAVQQAILGRLVGYFQTDIGTLNQVVHIWAYDSLEDRAKRRAKLYQDPGWLACVAKMRPLIRTMRNRILLPAPFSPLK
jgi:hypothetical protein